MPATSTLSEFLSSIALRGRSIMGIATDSRKDSTGAQLSELCRKLLSRKGDASGIAFSNEILTRYKLLPREEKLAFFQELSVSFSADSEAVRTAADAYLYDASAKNLMALSNSTEPARRKLITRLNEAPDATIQLIRMRAELLSFIAEDSSLKEVDRDFSKLFTSWFNGGFLQLMRLNWSSPASVLDNIMRYEAVHGMSDWDDLRSRLDPPDRLIFGFFHPRLGDEPLIFIEVALMSNTPSNIQSVLGKGREVVDPSSATTAVFYSISNCQTGLRGIPLGSFLIKRVVQDLQNTYPQLKQFVTLSPVPEFSRWLEKSIASAAENDGDGVTDDKVRQQLEDLRKLEWIGNEAQVQQLRDTVINAASYYFLEEKNEHGQPTDPVARFHLGNGANLERINWPADTSNQALSKACGIMVNYQYRLDEIEKNHEDFSETGKINASAVINKASRAHQKYVETRQSAKLTQS